LKTSRLVGYYDGSDLVVTVLWGGMRYLRSDPESPNTSMPGTASGVVK